MLDIHQCAAVKSFASALVLELHLLERPLAQNFRAGQALAVVVADTSCIAGEHELAAVALYLFAAPVAEGSEKRDVLPHLVELGERKVCAIMVWRS